MKKKSKNAYGQITLLLILAVIGFVIIYVSNQKMGSTFVKYAIDSRVEQVSDTKVANVNSVGWIRVQGTNIDYPIIYETPQAYRSGIDYTWVAHRPGEGENRLAIYGHNIQNVSSEPLIADENHVRFEQLMSFVYYDFAKDNLYIQYTHDGKDELYLIYAVGFVEDNEKGDTTTSLSETQNYIQTAIDNSLYRYNIEVNEQDTLISLITCTRYFGLEGRTQFRIDARKLRENEEVEKYAVQTTANYDIIK